MKYNKSKTYLLPLLSELVDFDPRFMKYLVNTYMYVDPSEKGIGPCLAILHNFSYKHPEFTAYEHQLTASDLFLKSYDIGNQVLYIYKFPDEYLPEYLALYKGTYSEFGDDAKELILSFWGKIYENNPRTLPMIQAVKNVLYKDDKLRLELSKKLGVTIEKGQELGSKINVEDETFNLI